MRLSATNESNDGDDDGEDINIFLDKINARQNVILPQKFSNAFL